MITRLVINNPLPNRQVLQRPHPPSYTRINRPTLATHIKASRSNTLAQKLVRTRTNSAEREGPSA